MKGLMLISCLLVAPFCMAMESRDLHGLDVRLERIHEPVVVDGVQMLIRSATGPAVPQLAARIIERWRGEGTPLQLREHAGWQLAVRLDGSRNELIQWRAGAGGGEAQLLHSILDVRRATGSTSPPPFRLPAACRWGRSIAGTTARTAYQQRTALCRAGAETILSLLRKQLAEQGWKLRADAASMLQVSRAGSEADVFVMQAPEPDQALVVWMAATTSPGAPP